MVAVLLVWGLPVDIGLSRKQPARQFEDLKTDTIVRKDKKVGLLETHPAVKS